MSSGVTRPMSSGVTRNLGPLRIIYPSRDLPPQLRIPGPPPPFHSLLQHLTWGLTWPADQRAHLTNARQPSPSLLNIKQCLPLFTGVEYQPVVVAKQSVIK